MPPCRAPRTTRAVSYAQIGLDVDATGKAHISHHYINQLLPMDTRLLYTTNKSGAWKTVELDGDPTDGDSCLEIEPKGAVTIVYNDETNNDTMKYLKQCP